MVNRAATSDNYRVVGVSPNLIQIEVIDTNEFKKAGEARFSIGSYLRISDDNNLSMIAVVQSYRVKQDKEVAADTQHMPSFIIDAQPVGFLDADNNFRRGGQHVAIPPTRVEVADGPVLANIYANVPAAKKFTFGSLAQDDRVDVSVDGDNFFSKHIAVVGSTGSGKSCTVAKLLQEGIRPSDGQSKKAILNNSHIVIFDLHGEYRSAFPSANSLSIENLVLPYWLLKSEELEEMFLEVSNEQNHNQRSQFRQAVIENKKRAQSHCKQDLV